MSAMVTRTLLEQQVDLMMAVLTQRHGILQHLETRIKPHVSDPVRSTVDDLIEALCDDELIDPNLTYYLDSAIGKIRSEIAAGTREDQIAIPRERLFGCAEAYEARTVRSPDAEALKAALPPLEAFYSATRQAFDFAAAIKASIWLLDQD